jgi:hypothetical protein
MPFKAYYMSPEGGFHHLAIEDCVSPLIRPPKIDDFGKYPFLVVHGINHMGESDIVETTELAFFLEPPLCGKQSQQSNVRRGLGHGCYHFHASHFTCGNLWDEL